MLKKTLTVLMLTVAAPCMGDTITVPGDYSTIQDAINAASNGDVIEVEAGLYVERLNPGGKQIMVRGTTDETGTPRTIVDGSAGGSVITINSNESKDSTKFENLVIRNGTGTPLFGQTHGGGIFVDFGDGATFNNCHIYSNTAQVTLSLSVPPSRAPQTAI